MHRIVRELKTEDTGDYKAMPRMSYEDFKVILRVRRRFHQANIVVVPCKRTQHCCATLCRSQNNRNVGTCCAKSLTGFKLYATSANIIVVSCKRTQNAEPSMLRVVGQQCCIRLHGTFRFILKNWE